MRALLLSLIMVAAFTIGAFGQIETGKVRANSDQYGTGQVALFEVSKKRIRAILPILRARTGKDIIYQEEEADKNGLGKN